MSAGVPGGFPGQSTSNNQPQIVSPFPAPPDYAVNYTTENIKAGKVLPPPPVPTKFSTFNQEYDLEGPILKPLTEMGITQFYDRSKDWKSDLKKLNRSIVAAFLDLLELLIKSPEHPDRQTTIDTIRLLFINMHHLINEYRPVQARDTLKQMAMRQNKEIRAITEKLRMFLEAGNESIESLQTAFKAVDLVSVPATSHASSDAHQDLSSAVEQKLVGGDYASEELVELLRMVDGLEAGVDFSDPEMRKLDLSELVVTKLSDGQLKTIVEKALAGHRAATLKRIPAAYVSWKGTTKKYALLRIAQHEPKSEMVFDVASKTIFSLFKISSPRGGRGRTTAIQDEDAEILVDVAVILAKSLPVQLSESSPEVRSIYILWAVLRIISAASHNSDVCEQLQRDAEKLEQNAVQLRGESLATVLLGQISGTNSACAKAAHFVFCQVRHRLSVHFVQQIESAYEQNHQDEDEETHATAVQPAMPRIPVVGYLETSESEEENNENEGAY